MVAEVGSMPAASSVKKPFGFRRKMGKWCCHCFPCCRGSGKVDASGDQDDSAMKTLKSKMAKWCCHCLPCRRGSGKSNTGASGDQDDSAMKTHRSKMAKWCCHCLPCRRGSGKSNLGASGDQDDSAVKTVRSSKSNMGAWEEYDDSAFMEPRYHVRGEDLDKLHRAAWWGKVPRKDLIVMLRDTDCEQDGQAKEAIQCQEDECALMLLEHGTDPNIPDEFGNTTLHYAVYNEDKLMAKALLLHGAAIESKNKHGFTPLLLGIHEQKQQMVKFLIKKKANLNALDRYGRTALILAVRCRSASIVSLLLEQNIDISSQDLSGQTAREYAVSSHHNVICQLFSDYKEKRMLKISSENSNPGKTCDTLFPVCPFSGITELLTSRKYSKHINLLFLHLQKMSEEPEINKDCDREVEEVKKHGSNHVGLPENLTDGAAAVNGDDGLIPQRKSRTPGSQQFPDTENEECHSDEQNDTQKQISEEQSTGISQDEILTNKQKQIEVAEKKMNSEVRNSLLQEVSHFNAKSFENNDVP
ncbi:hypothetical protein H8959_017592 [Pygathrix nigripes]